MLKVFSQLQDIINVMMIITMMTSYLGLVSKQLATQYRVDGL